MIGALTGLLTGGLLGFIKNKLIWSRSIDKSNEEGYNNESAQVYGRLLASNALNIIILVIVFLMRNIVPVEWVSFLLGAATGLVAMNFITAGARK